MSLTAAARLVLLTGGTRGIGLEAAKALLADGKTKVVTTGRAAESPIKHSNHTYIPLELRERNDIRSFVSSWSHGPIDFLILNAGMWARDEPIYDRHKVEETSSVNLVNQALLFFLLLSKGNLARNYRIIFLSTQLHNPKYAPAKGDRPVWVGPAGVASSDDKRLANPATRYITSKLGVIMFAYALHRHIQAGSAKSGQSIIYDPAFVPGTSLTRDVKPYLKFIADYILPNILPLFRRVTGMQTATPIQAGAWMAALARADSSVKPGEFIELGKAGTSSEESYDEKKQEELWNWILDTVAVDEAERNAFTTAV